MEWQRPEWLYLILPLAVAWLALSLNSRRLRRRAAAAFVAQAMWSRILPHDSPGRFSVKLLLREIAIVTALVALAGPRFGTQYEEVIPRGSDLYVLIDVSRSMLAEDVPPSRLGRAKADVAALVNRLDGERVGLIAFAGQAVVKCPLTVDYDAFRRSLDELDPASAPRGGTAIGDAIRKALEVFQAHADRDQAILLITDGDDQQSYPLEAAAVAAERHVTIFTVGLGDANQGARIPQSGQSKSYLEYQGHQVWSKLDGSLLKEIALKTSGVYVPVETRAYDLGELYAKYLQGRRGSEEQSRTRIRRADQFQIFLALAVLALLADALIRPYRAEVKSPEPGIERKPPTRARGASLAGAGQAPVHVSAALVVCALLAANTRADNPAEEVRDGLRFYGKGDFDKARDKFAKAREQFDSRDAAKAAIAAFDQACALHRKGDVAQARQAYLKAGLAHDKGLAASAHFNLGTLAAEEARRLAGEKPEEVAPDKRQEVLDQLQAAVVSFRHCLDLQPDNSRARHDIELVRQWIKYYTDRWHARDRETRRNQTNLVAFLEFLIETERALRESVKSLTANAPADAYAEPKRLQEELQEEIAPLKEKIKTELTPPAQPAGSPAPPANSQEIEQGIALLQGWADAAGNQMQSAARRLGERQAEPAATDQQSAIDELEKIWDAVIPFHALLARDLSDQTQITQALAPASAADAQPATDEPSDRNSPQHDKAAPAQKAPSTAPAPPSLNGVARSEEGEPPGEPPAHSARSASGGPAADHPPGIAQGHLGTKDEDLAPIAEGQERTQRRTRLLKLKAEAELERLEKSGPPGAEKNGQGAGSTKNNAPAPAPGQPSTPDPKQVRAGYQKAIELGPRAVDRMEQAVKSLKKKDRSAAYPPAEDARKILEEIQKAQPKQDDKDQKNQDQDQKKEDQKKEDQEKKDQNDEQKKEQQKEEQKKDDRDKKDEQKKEQEKKKQDESSKSDDQKQAQKKEQPQPQVSRDRIEDALRKVRERQQEKRERDRTMKARLFGRVPVEKDW
jgi:Ca-activated chloride channel family protein